MTDTPSGGGTEGQAVNYPLAPPLVTPSEFRNVRPIAEKTIMLGLSDGERIF